MEMLLYLQKVNLITFAKRKSSLILQKGKVFLLLMNLNVNPICRNVNINIFAECKWYIKGKPSL